MTAERGYGKTERGLAEEAKAERGYRGGTPISFYFNRTYPCFIFRDHHCMLCEMFDVFHMSNKKRILT